MRRTFATLLIGVAAGTSAIAQTGTAPTGVMALASSSYLRLSALPSPVRLSVGAVGTRLLIPGKERTTLSGTYTDKSGTTTPSQLIWQSPGSLRFQRSGAVPALVYNATTGIVNASAITAADANVLESLLDDSAEAFFYGFGRGYAYRLMGERFRGDDGKTPNFTGPWFDVYQVAGSPRAQPTVKQRWKTYLFDSTTKLLTRTQYMDSAGVQVTTQFTGWSVSGGQAYPGQIVRLENGVPVFTFSVSSATAGPAQNDTLFSAN